MTKSEGPIDLSVIVPVFNECESIVPMIDELLGCLQNLDQNFEVLLVNDGSSDGSFELIEDLTKKHRSVKAIHFDRNYGQTAALLAGFDHSLGEIIITLDGDMQNDPRDIKRLLDKQKEGYDVVSGWRANRKDKAIRRVFVSKIANRVISAVAGVKLHDYGCTLKVYRQSSVKNLNLYGEMHRFIPIYASWKGAKVAELEVNHRARQFGRSKYGLERVLKVILDLLLIRFLDRYLARPIHFFGKIGAGFALSSVISFAWMIALKILGQASMIDTPLPVLTAILGVASLTSVLLGLLAEIIVRVYFSTGNNRSYQLSPSTSTENS